MRAAHNAGWRLTGQSGAGMVLPSLPVVHVLERRVGRHQVPTGQWVDVWYVEGKPHASAGLAGSAADVLRAQGFTVRIRPVVLHE